MNAEVNTYEIRIRLSQQLSWCAIGRRSVEAVGRGNLNLVICSTTSIQIFYNMSELGEKRLV